MTRMTLYVFIGAILGVLSLLTIQKLSPSLFASMPEKDSFEAMVMCNEFRNTEDKLDGDNIQKWVSAPIINKLDEDTEHWPESARSKFFTEAEPYLNTLRSGVITESAINNLSYLYNSAKPE